MYVVKLIRGGSVFLITCVQEHNVIAMRIDITQWKIQITCYWKFVGRVRRGKFHGVKNTSATSLNPLLALVLSFCLITAPSLLPLAGGVEWNPGPPKLQSKLRVEIKC